MNKVQLIECPRDAMQGWKQFIPTQQKVAYINTLLQIGFHTIDFGSFVSPKAIPQMADTATVLQGLNLTNTKTKLLAIVANVRGATDAVVYQEIDFFGFPFSISPTFQLRNANSTIEASLETVASIQELCVKNNKQLVIYLSMAFGNPYGDVYNETILMEYTDKISELGITIISLADTVGVATPLQISSALQYLIPKYKNIEFGVHLHSAPHNWHDKLAAAVDAGCYRIDGALKGIGGCPMANDDLVGNLATENIISFLKAKNIELKLNDGALLEAMAQANQLFI
jgi:hydroxymethylglutaryl-CoA lyase